MNLRLLRASLFVAVISLLALPFGFVQLGVRASAHPQTDQENAEKSLRAFRQVASVLTSPRCLNCHVPDDGPLQGDDDHPHTMNVKRGADGKGSAALRCFACHQLENATALHGPP
ncbi:MAG TPA: hypothetical protein VFQ41_25795, partial [Candidatus Angelobacter sp.]|nr:hypothetical protein [Candidatus Angelobacter sp.]